MPERLSAFARLVHVHLLASGRGVLIDDALLDVPGVGAVQEIAVAMSMAAVNVLAGLTELIGRGFLITRIVKFPGVLPVRMLFPL